MRVENRLGAIQKGRPANPGGGGAVCGISDVQLLFECDYIDYINYIDFLKSMKRV